MSSGLVDVDDAGVVDRIASSARSEAIACAARLAAIAELYDRRAIVVEDDCGRELWAFDTWDAVAAEVGAAEGITAAAASSQLRYALVLRDRLPRVGALFAQGLIGFRVVRVAISRTDFVLRHDMWACIDGELAVMLQGSAPMSQARLEQAIDSVIARHDPGAVRSAASRSKSRHVGFDTTSADGTAALWGLLYATDARALDRRLTEMTHTVCDADPRTLDQRRADALGALAAKQQSLACGCGNKDCVADSGDKQAPTVIVHVVAESAQTSGSAELHGVIEDGVRELHSYEEVVAEIRNATPPEYQPPLDPPDPHPPVIIGGPVLPPSVVAELITSGRALVRRLHVPGPEQDPEPRYRPSQALADFVRCRDLTCRFPGCGRPADLCEIDHTIPYSCGGLTHASNLKALCKKHHLLKTFWRGPDGWTDRQLSEGTVIWTAPSGHTYRTEPGSKLLIPSLSVPTGNLPESDIVSLPTVSGLTMPKRQQTRAKARHARILRERATNP